MQEIGTRFLIAAGMLWLGLNLRNLIWQFMSGFLYLEWMILKGKLVVALISAAILIGIRVTSLINEVDAEERESPRPSCDEIFRSSSNDHAYSVTVKQRKILEPKKELPRFYEVPMSARASETPSPIPRALTSEELKQKAVSQIMGGK